MSDSERKMLGQYRRLVSNYQDSFPLELNLFTDSQPPKDLMIEIKALEDCGELILEGGKKINILRSQTYLVRKSSVEQLLMQKKIIQTK